MSYSEDNTFEKILDRMLAQDILANMDKRAGSIIYDALAPCAMELAEAYAKIDILQEQTYLMTATGDNLEKRVYDYGIVRNEATQALRIGEFKKYKTDSDGNYVYNYNYVEPKKQGDYEYNSQTDTYTYVGANNGDYIYDSANETYVQVAPIKQGNYEYDSETETYTYVGENQGDYVKGDKILVDMDIPEGSRFAVPDNENVIFKYVGITDGYKILQCESAGSGGNEHIGIILPLTPIGDLIQAKITSTYQYGEDEESDDDLRTRTKNYLNETAFGGNIADYIEKVNAIDGVGNLKVFPAWQHNGSVLLSVVDPSYNPITQEFANLLKEEIDPEESSGQGTGIAPIGHIVTITTPVEETVDVELTISIDQNAVSGEITTEVEEVLANYINSVRKKFAQDVTLAVYRARIIERILDGISDVLNVTDVMLNNTNADVIYTDEGLIGHQYLPKLGEVTINYE